MARAMRSRHPRHHHTSRPSRIRSNQISYREPSTSEESGDEDYVEDARTTTIRSRLAPRVEQPPSSPEAPPQRTRKRKAAFSQTLHPPVKKVKIEDEEVKSQDGLEANTILSGGKIPPWNTLPYHILVQVLGYAAGPLIEDHVIPLRSTEWLLRTALVCKAFAEPAISVLYYAPPLSPPSRARGLLAHLQRLDDKCMFNYRAKVKYLDIHGSATLYRKNQGHDPIDIAELLAIVPQLRGMGIHRAGDLPKYNRIVEVNNTSKSIQVLRHTISALQEHKPQLQEWKWSAVVSGYRNIFNLNRIHRTAPFHNLRKLTMVEFDSRYCHEKGRGKPEEELAKAISALPNLMNLQLIMCNDVNGKLLPLLPQGLQELEITDCPINSTMLRPFLASHGHSLRRLILDHNQSLNLGFAVDLRNSCSSLELLKMDLTYYNQHYTFADFEPKFETLLPFGQAPTWPVSLQHLELIHLRKWNIDAANAFFASLVDSAGDLPHLQRLIIKASLSESGWRERINFRDRWIARLEKVFLRKAEPPNPHLRSITTFQAEKMRNPNGLPLKRKTPCATKVRVEIPRSAHPISEVPPSRHERNLRRNTTTTKEPANQAISDSTSDSDAPLITTRRRSSRLAHDDSEAYTSRATPPRRQRARPRRRIKHTDGDSSSSEDSALDEDIDSAPNNNNDSQTSIDVDADAFDVIQGVCDVVRVQIDNLRPMEEKLVEDDFMDDELSGDGDWNGEDRDDEDGYAW